MLMCSLYAYIGERILLTTEKPHLYEYKHKYLVTKTYHLKLKENLNSSYVGSVRLIEKKKNQKTFY